MSLKKLATGFIVTLTFASIAAAGVASSNFSFVASAATEDFLVFLEPNSNWLRDNARFAVYCFDNGTQWVDMTETSFSNASGSKIFTAKVPAKYPKFILCRMNPNNKTNNWDNKWNQSADLLVSSGNNYYWTNNWDIGSSDSCKKYVATIHPDNADVYKDIVYSEDEYLPSFACGYDHYYTIYTDAGKTKEYSKGKLTGHTDFYPSYSRFEYSTDLFLEDYGWNNKFVYAFENINGHNFKSLGEYGSETNVAHPVDNVTLNGKSMVHITVPYHDASNVKFIYTDGTDNNKSADTSLVADSYFNFSGDGNKLASNTSIGKAADTIWSIVSNMGATEVETAYGKKDSTICDIKNNQPAVKAEIISKYNALRNDSAAKEAFDNATLDTFNTVDYDEYDAVSFSDVLNEIAGYDIVNGASSSNRLMIKGNGNVSTACIITGLVTVSLAGLGLFLLKKKKTA